MSQFTGQQTVTSLKAHRHKKAKQDDRNDSKPLGGSGLRWFQEMLPEVQCDFKIKKPRG